MFWFVCWKKFILNQLFLSYFSSLFLSLSLLFLIRFISNPLSFLFLASWIMNQQLKELLSVTNEWFVIVIIFTSPSSLSIFNPLFSHSFLFQFLISLSFNFSLILFLSFSSLSIFLFLQEKELVEIFLLNLINCIQLTVPSTNKLVLFVFLILSSLSFILHFHLAFSPNSFSLYFFFQFSSPLPPILN